jgi:hypothetical protein
MSRSDNSGGVLPGMQVFFASISGKPTIAIKALSS